MPLLPTRAGRGRVRRIRPPRTAVDLSRRPRNQSQDPRLIARASSTVHPRLQDVAPRGFHLLRSGRLTCAILETNPRSARRSPRSSRHADAQTAATKFYELKETDPSAYNFGRGEPLKLSHRLRAEGRAEDPVMLARLALEAEEELSRHAYFTLALAHLALGDQGQALEYCRRKLELDQYDSLALEVARQLENT